MDHTITLGRLTTWPASSTGMLHWTKRNTMRTARSSYRKLFNFFSMKMIHFCKGRRLQCPTDSPLPLSPRRLRTPSYSIESRYGPRRADPCTNSPTFMPGWCQDIVRYLSGTTASYSVSAASLLLSFRWHNVVSVTMFIFAVICIEVVHTDLPVWGKSSPRQLDLLI